MHYIKKHLEGIEVAFPYRKVVLEKGMNQFLNHLLLNELTTLSGRIEALKKKYALKYHVPIVVNQQVCFFTLRPLRHPHSICLNIYAIKSFVGYETTQTMIVFHNYETLILNYPYHLLKKRFDQTKTILEKLSNEARK